MKYILQVDGNERNEKIVEVTQTKHFLNIEFIDKNTEYGTWYKQGDKIKCRFDNKSKHCLKDWGDGEYTIYPNRGGVPYYIRPAND